MGRRAFLSPLPERLDIAPTTRAGFAAKLLKVRKFLPLFDWVFWIDGLTDALLTEQELGVFRQRHLPPPLE